MCALLIPSRGIEMKLFQRFLLLMLLCSVSEIGIADEALWQEYFQAGIAAYEHGEYVEAAKQAKAALEVATDFGEDDPRYAISLATLGVGLWCPEQFRRG